MWSIIAGIFAALVGFGAGASGLGQVFPNQSVPVTQYTTNACFAPEMDVKITLKWPDNFINLSDNRVVLNPNVFGSKPPTFNADNACQEVLLINTLGEDVNPRTYIRVRRDVRITSCKTDELAGPYVVQKGSKTPSCPEKAAAAANVLRGSCDVGGYTDLRKIAEANVDGETKEIFWVPFSHNVGCDYKENSNCGPGDRTNLNLREFIYVVTKRDAFDPDNPQECTTVWDAKNPKACSHYFDIYMAEDLYNKLINLQDVPPTDKYYDTWSFYKQVLENCQEQSTFTPVVDVPGLSFPPSFIKTPFVTDASQFYQVEENKLIPQIAPTEGDNYTYFILSSSSINPFETHLLQLPTAPDQTIVPCIPGSTRASATGPSATPTPVATLEPSCYAPLGIIQFTKPETTIAVRFQVYSRYDTPETFYFKDQSGDDPKVYTYTITDETPPQNLIHNPALQLTDMEFRAGNDWTWGTPWCKPAIYMYPTKPTDMNVKLEVAGELTVSDPSYDPTSGWNVTAYPDGKLTTYNLLPTTYPYLYYEADVKGVTIPSEGWVIERSNIKDQISKILEEIGFNDREIADFMEYWLPRLTEKPYYFVTLMPENVINEKEKLTFSSTPDTLIRTRVVFEGLDAPASAKPLATIPHYERKGFVVTDWGGTLIGKSCTDVTVK